MSAVGVSMIGGEMPVWSDLDDPLRPPAGGPLAVRLTVPAARGGRILLAGPHRLDVVAAVAATGAAVTCLVRGRPDADALAARGHRVLCGTLSKLPAEPEYDAVVALDGLGRLCSPDGPQHTWAESLHLLGRTLRPGGVLLVTVENELGVHRLVEPLPADRAGAWQDRAEFDTRPGSPSRLARLLTAEDLTVDRLYAAWPVPAAPTVLAEPGSDAGPGGILGAAVAAAFATAYAGRRVLADPRRLGASANRAGLGAAFAPAWLVLAHRGPDGPPVPGPILLAEHGLVRELVPDGGGRWSGRGPGGAPLVLPGGIGRDPDRLDGPLPGGRLLEEALLSACVHHELDVVRRLLTGWAAWLPSSGAPVFATADNVTVDGDRFAVLDPSWTIDDAVPVAVAATRALRRFATVLELGGYPHPWPAVSGVDALTAVLAAVAGVPPDPAAVDLDIRITVARTGADPGAVADRVRRPGVGTPVAGPDAWTERAATVERLHEQLVNQRARADFAEREIVSREAELRRLRLLAAAFSGSPGYRLLRLGRAAARRVRRLLPSPR